MLTGSRADAQGESTPTEDEDGILVVEYDSTTQEYTYGDDGQEIPVPPQSRLAHELIHALHDAEGTTRPPSEEDPTPDEAYREGREDPGRQPPMEESVTTGTGAGESEEITENAIRRELGLPPPGTSTSRPRTVSQVARPRTSARASRESSPRRAAALAGLGVAAMVVISAAGRFLGGRASSPSEVEITSTVEVLASLGEISGLDLDVTVSAEEDAQHLKVLITNHGDDPVVFEERQHAGTLRVYVDDADLLILSVNGRTVRPEERMDSALRVKSLVHLGPGQSFRETIVVPDRVAPTELVAGKAKDGDPGTGGPVRSAIVAFDVLVVEDASQLRMESNGQLYTADLFPRWRRVGVRLPLARPVVATPIAPSLRVMDVVRPPLPPLTGPWFERRPGATP